MDKISAHFDLAVITSHKDFKRKYPKSSFNKDIERHIASCSIKLSGTQIKKIKTHAWECLFIYVYRTEEFDGVQYTQGAPFSIFNIFNYGIRADEKNQLETLGDALSKIASLSKIIPTEVLCQIEAIAIGIKTRKPVDHDKTPSFFDYNKLIDLRNATRGLLDRRSKKSAKKTTRKKELKKWAIDGFLDSYISGLLSIIKTPPKSGHTYNRELEELIKSTLEIFSSYRIPLNKYETPSGGSLPLRDQVRKIMNNAWSSSSMRSPSG